MSCGCKNAKDSDPSEIDSLPISHYQLPNETTECFMRRIGQQDPSPDPNAIAPKDKIATQFIPVDCELKVDTTFKMTEGSKPVTWQFELKDPDGNVIQPSTIGLTYSNSSNPTLTGTVAKEHEGKKFSAHMKAIAAEANPDINVNVGDVVDEKEYSIFPKACDKNSLRLIHPNPGARTTSQFGPREAPVPGASTFHKGVDFSSKGQNQIIAAGDGTVTAYTGVHSGYGNIVEIEHTDSSGKVLAKTRYAHLSQVFVRPGDKVAAGQAIGHEGNTGIGSGPHLHFEVLLGGSTHVDPLKYINGTIDVADASENGVVNPDQVDQASSHTQTNRAKGITADQVDAVEECKPQEIQDAASAADRTKSPPVSMPASPCKPPDAQPVSKDEVAKRIRDTARAEGASDDEVRYMLKIAYLESSYDPYAKNPKSSATGLFQMLDGTSGVWYGKAGIQPTCENRCDIEKSTKAMYQMVKYEAKGYDSFHANGTIAGANPGRVVDNAYTSNYGSLSKEEFMYMSHGQGQEGMRRGTPGGVDFYNHFKRKSPTDSEVDRLMNL